MSRRNIHPNTLAAIEPHRMKPGTTLNPKGRPKIGLSVIEWQNIMAKWTRAKLMKVMQDSNSTIAKLMAARTLLHATSLKTTTTGQPIAGADYDRVMDRSIGSPKQTTDLTSGDKPLKAIIGIDIDQV